MHIRFSRPYTNNALGLWDQGRDVLLVRQHMQAAVKWVGACCCVSLHTQMPPCGVSYVGQLYYMSCPCWRIQL